MCRGLLLIVLLLTNATASIIAQPTRAVRYPNTFIARNIDNASGLAGSMIQGIAQDRQGYIWIGTEKGLQRYDGLRFQNCFGPQTNPQELYVRDVYPDDTHGRLLFEQGPNKIMQWDYLRHTTSPATAAVHPGHFQILWSDSNNTQTHGLISFKAPGDTATIIATFTRRKGTDQTWIAASAQYLLLLDERTNTIQPLPFAFDPHTIHGLQTDSHGNLWLYSWNDLFYRYDGKTLHKYSLKDILKQEGNQSTIPVWIGAMLEDDHGVLWLGTGQAGLLKYDYDKDEFGYLLKQPGNSLALQYIDQINTLFQDKEENIWLGTDKGISIINPYRQYFTTLSNQDTSNPANVVSDIIPVSLIHNEIWMGSWGGGIKVFDTAFKFKRQIFFPGRYEENMVWCFLPRGDGSTWVGCQTGLIHIIDAQGKITQTLQPQETEHRTIKCIVNDQKGNIILGLHSGKIIVYDTSTHRFLNYEGSNTNLSPIENLYIDDKNHCWASTSAGLAEFDLDTRKFVNVYNPGLPVRCWGVCGYQDSLLVVGTENDGLYFFNRDKHTFRKIPVNEEQSHWTAYAVKVDEQGKIWFSTDYTICCYNPATGKCTVSAPERGLLNSGFVAKRFIPFTQGRWITWTATELVCFNPDLLQATERTASKVTITGFRVFSSPLYIDSALRNDAPVNLGYKQNFISIDFSNLQFAGIQRARYYYQLEGIDPSWVYGGGRGNANYTNLSPGDYTFRVRTAGDGGITSMRIRIKAPFWETWWFRTLVIVSIIAIVYTLIRWRDKRLRRESLLKQRVIRTEMMALQAQMNPHFIFNCINGIDALIQSDDKYHATVYLNKFARLIRNILDSSRHETITLERDLETLQLYIDLERFRSEDRFVAEIHVDAALLEEDCRVPPLIVQPYVENAILHGLRPKPGNTGRLKIDISRKSGYLVYRIEDNGVGREAAKEKRPHHSYGMEIGKDRVDLFNREEQTPIVITDLTHDGNPVGTVVQVSLKISEWS